jgi:hypothetical protein
MVQTTLTRLFFSCTEYFRTRDWCRSSTWESNASAKPRRHRFVVGNGLWKKKKVFKKKIFWVRTIRRKKEGVRKRLCQRYRFCLHTCGQYTPPNPLPYSSHKARKYLTTNTFQTDFQTSLDRKNHPRPNMLGGWWTRTLNSAPDLIFPSRVSSRSVRCR